MSTAFSRSLLLIAVSLRIPSLLTELLMTRTNLEIHTLKQAYKALGLGDVTQLVKGELSAKTVCNLRVRWRCVPYRFADPSIAFRVIRNVSLSWLWRLDETSLGS